MISTDVGVWIGVFMTIGVFSYLYKDNPWYHVVETILVGFNAAFVLVAGVNNIVDLGINEVLNGNFIRIIPIVLGCLLYMRFVKKYAIVGIWAIALIFGVGTGVVIRSRLAGDIISQIVAATSIDFTTTFDFGTSIIMLIATITTLYFFIFTRSNEGVSGTISKIGRYAIMIAFGASFGNTVGYRFGILLGRLNFLLFKWLGLG